MKAARAPVIRLLVWLGDTATYLLLIVITAKGSIDLVVPWTTECQYGDSSRMHFASSMRIVMSESPAPSQRMDGRSK